ncbi:hypothetical protein H3T12_21155 [Streptomyces sp. GMR22]|nr:hypothetical protein [Streptomyces sp. GMR22]
MFWPVVLVAKQVNRSPSASVKRSWAPDRVRQPTRREPGVDLGDGNDAATVTGSAYTSIHGGKGNDVLKDSAAAVLYGDDGNDRLDGGGGVWSMGPFGGSGNDTITNCDAERHGGPGNDSLTGTASGQDFGLYGDDGNEVVYGGSGADLVHGDSGNDLLHGGTGMGTLSGGLGSDKVYQNENEKNSGL